jgi:hypothetical protein
MQSITICPRLCREFLPLLPLPLRPALRCSSQFRSVPALPALQHCSARPLALADWADRPDLAIWD